MMKNLLIFGAGSYARRVARAFQGGNYQVRAFVTSRANSLDSIDDIPVYCLESLPGDLKKVDAVAVGVFNRCDSYQEIAYTLESHGLFSIYWPWDYYQYLHNSLGWCYWLDSEPRSISQWKQEPAYLQLVSLLADEESKGVVKRILSFRSGADLSFSAFKSQEDQYFNPLTIGSLPTDRAVRYLDVGAFNGDTLQQLCRHAEVGVAVLLEPDPRNYQKLLANVSALVDQYPGLSPLPLPLGAGGSYGSFLLSGEGEAVTLGESVTSNMPNRQSITVVSIDDLVPVETVDFVKIDVEGHDREAIEGMKKLLLRSSPVVAVSLYHRPHDIIELPLYLMQILSGLDYRYYIRQHMYNSFDSVLYALPCK
jgi:FkbM family methyltransferase